MTHHDAPSGQPYSPPPIWDERHIGEMVADEEGWTVPWAVTTTPAGLYINSDYPIQQRPGATSVMHLRRVEDGLIVTHEGDDDHPRILGMQIPPDRIIAGWPHMPPPTPPPVPNPGISEGHGGDDGGGGRKHRKWPWAVGVLALIVVGGVAAGNGADPKPPAQGPVAGAPSMPPLSQEQKDANAKASTAPKAPPAPTATVVPVPPAAPKLTVSQQNAVESARSYLDSQGFSRLGLIGQLTGFEGYSTADATFAVDYVRADWKKQAVRVAQGYLDSGSFSRSGLITQLTQFEKFTRAQATYAADKVGL